MRKNAYQVKASKYRYFAWRGAEALRLRETKQYALSNLGWSIVAVAQGLAVCLVVGCGSSNESIDPASGSQAGSPAIAVAGSSAAALGGSSTIGVGGTTSSVQGGAGGKSGSAGTTGSGGKSATGKAGATGAAGKKPKTAGAGGKKTDGSAGTTGLGLIAVDKIDGMDGAKGPYATAPEDLATGPSGASGVFRPADLGKNGEKHPVFVWSCGGSTNPTYYVEHMNHIASYGIVVIADAPPTPATGEAILASMDWIIKQNETQGSDFYQKLDTTKIGIGGHSMGSLNTLIASADPRVQASVLVCGGGSGTGGSDKMHAPALYLGGVGEMGTANFEGDYENTPSPTVFLIKEDTDHIMCARNNIMPWIAWLRWHLAGETKWKLDFFDGGAYCKSPWAECRNKNW